MQKTLEQTKAEGREGFAEGCTPMNISDPPSDHEWINTFLDQHTANTGKACLATILESGLLEEKANIPVLPARGSSPSEYHKAGKVVGYNTLARDIKEFISNMDTNSVDSIHLNKQAN